MTAKMKVMTLAGIALSMLASGCGKYADQGQSPARVVVLSLEGRSGVTGATFGATLESDVLTIVGTAPNQVPTIFSDSGRVTMSLVLLDQGNPGVPAKPSSLNQVTFTRYRVQYRRADGRNTPGVDVPFPFDSAATFTVPESSNVQVGFELVRHTAKEESPLRGLANNTPIISTITDVTFYGRDLAGHDVTVTGSIGILFGDFADPK